MLNGRWHKVGFVVYADSNGNVTARCHGHQVIAILTSRPPFRSCGRTSRASMGERDACRQAVL